MSESERRQRTISSTPRLTPEEVSARSFPTAFRGISESDVRAFLKRVAEDLGALRSREQELSQTIDELEARLRTPKPLDEQELLDALGEETTRLIRSAREAASDIRGKAEERAARLVHDAHEAAERVRQEADDVLGVKTLEAESVATGMIEEADQRAGDLMRGADERAHEVRAEADRYGEDLRARVDREAANTIEHARARAAALVEEATNLRQRVIEDLARRRELLTGQLEELRTGRDELLDAYRIVKRTFLEATDALAQVEAKATAGRPAPTSDPADLAESLAAETESARAAGLDADAAAPGAAPTEATDSESSDASDASDGPDPDGSTPTETADASERVAAVLPGEAAASTETAPVESASVDADPAAPGSVESGSVESVSVESAPVEDAPSAASDEPAGDDGSESATPNLADVDDLFARLRAGAQAEAGAVDPAGDSADAVVASTSGPTSAVASTPNAVTIVGSETKADTASDDAPEWFTRRDEALKPLRASLVRQVKLAIGNEQNEVLDKVRRHKGRPVAAAALPELDAQAEAWTAVLVSATSQAYRLALPAPDDGSAKVPGDVASGLARAMVEPLRDRLVATIDGSHEPGETSGQVAERIGARYREWKNRSAESSADDALVAAYSRGVYDGAPEGAVLTWHVPPGGCCVDCADNALEPTLKGEPFPTGHEYPPAHPGCRCALTTDE